MTKISIIVPVYNSEKYIQRCICSVTSQNPSGCEIILIDDGSKDKSLEKMNELAKQYNYIQVIHQINQGVSMARNTGLKAASGEWIYFLDSDDVLEPGAIDRMMTYIQQDCQWIVFNYAKQIEGTNKKYINEMRGAEYELHSNKEAFPQLLNEQVFMLQGGKLFRRDIIEEKQLYFPKQVVYGEDIRFNMQYFKYVNRYIVSDFSLFIYNIRQGEGAGSAYYDNAFEMQMDIDREIIYMDKHYYHLSTRAKKELNRYFFYQGINTAAAYLVVWKELSLKKRCNEIRRIMKDKRFIYFLEKQKEYKDIHLIDYILLKHKNYIGYYWVHFIYTHLKQWRYKEKYESRNCNNYKRI